MCNYLVIYQHLFLNIQMNILAMTVSQIKFSFQDGIVIICKKYNCIFKKNGNILIHRNNKIITILSVWTGWTLSPWTMASCTASRTSSNYLSHGETTTRASASTHTRTNGRRTPTIPRARHRSRSQMANSDFPNLPSHPLLPLYIAIKF